MFSSCSLLSRLTGVILLFICTAAPAARAIEVDITTQLGDEQVYYAGDNLNFMLSLDDDAYIYLFYQDAQNHLLQLLPNANYPQNYFKAGSFQPIPDPRAQFSFKVQEPFGTDRVWAFALEQPAPALTGKPLENGLILIPSDIGTVRNQLKAHAGQFFGESSKPVVTRPAAD